MLFECVLLAKQLFSAEECALRMRVNGEMRNNGRWTKYAYCFGIKCKRRLPYAAHNLFCMFHTVSVYALCWAWGFVPVVDRQKKARWRTADVVTRESHYIHLTTWNHCNHWKLFLGRSLCGAPFSIELMVGHRILFAIKGHWRWVRNWSWNYSSCQCRSG